MNTMRYRAPAICLLAAAAVTACSTPIPEELDPMVELQPVTFQDCAELDSFLNQRESLPSYVKNHNYVPDTNLGFEDVAGFEHMTEDGDFAYVTNGARMGIFAERDQQARAVGAVVVGDLELGDRILGVHVADRRAVVLVGMSQETAPLRDTVLPTRPADAAILRAMVFDVTDPRSPQLQRSIFIDGGLERGWVVDGKVTLVARTGLHSPPAGEGRGRNLPLDYPYLYDLNAESGDAWVHQDDPVAYCIGAVSSNTASDYTSKMLVSFDLDDEEPGLSTAWFLGEATVRHATSDSAVFLDTNGRSEETGREEGTYIYRFATDGDRPRLSNWAQVTGWHAGDSPVDEYDGELRVGTDRSFWQLGIPDDPGPLERDQVVWGLLPREEVLQWRFQGAGVYGQSVEWEERSSEAHRYMVWRLDTDEKSKRSVGPDMPPEQKPALFELTDANELVYISEETYTERNDRDEEVPVREHFRGRVVDLGTTPARRIAAFQYEADIDSGANFGGPFVKYADGLYGFRVPKLGEFGFHESTENGVLLRSQGVNHVDAAGRPAALRDTLVFDGTIWTMSDVAIALVDAETLGVTHYYDL